MKKFYSFLVVSVLATGAFAQCIPNPLAATTVVYPMPTDPLPDGSAGLPYQGTGVTVSFAASGQPIDPADLMALFPSLSLPIPPGLATFSVNKVTVESVEGLPAGMTATSSDTPSEWNSGDAGCFRIAGTPTAAGDYEVTFNTTLVIHYVVTLGGQQGDVTTPSAPIPYEMRINDNASVAEFSTSGLNLFPNPANEMFSISYPSTGADIATIDVTDMSGKVVYSTNQSINAQGGTIQIATDALANGFYRVTFTSGAVRTASKLVVRK